MGKFITNFGTTAEYNSAKSNFDLPHVSLTKDNMIVHYHPLVAKLYDYLYEDGLLLFYKNIKIILHKV